MNIFRNVKYAYYALKTNRLCSLISVIGLTLGLVCVFVIAKQIQQELTTDCFHSSVDRIYCMVSKASPGDKPSLAGFWSAETLRRDYPAVENATNIRAYPKGGVVHGGRLYHVDVLAVDSVFGKMFSFPMLTGDMLQALSDPGNAVITERLAKQIYGQKFPVGETLEYWGILYKVAAVVKDLPANSSLTFDLLVPTQEKFNSRMAASWIILKPDAAISAVALKREYFMSFQELYFNNNIDRGLLPMLKCGHIYSLWVLGYIGLAVLIVSLFNYVNIYQVTLLKRSKELGIKKVFGNTASRLYLSFWLENLLIVFVSMTLAVVVVVLLSGVLADKIGLLWAVNWKFDLLFPLGLVLLCPLIMALWPYSKYRTVRAVEAIRTEYAGYSSSWLRKGLLLGQYVMTTLMIIVSLYFMEQLDFMLNREIGLNRDNIIQVPFFNDDQYIIETASEEAFSKHCMKRRAGITYVREELRRHPDIKHICNGSFPLEIWEFQWKNEQAGMEMQTCATLSVAPEFLPLFGMKIKEGRFFDREQDSDRCQKIVINESAKKYFGVQNIQSAELVAMSWGKYQIVGVAEDFRFEHLAKSIRPLVMTFFESNDDPTLMHTTAGKEAETLLFLEKLFKEVTTESDFSYRYFDDVVKAQYQDDQRTVKVFSIFTAVAVFVSAIGLFGFSVFDMQQRYREVALRKVHGANRREVFLNLIGQYYALIGISFVIACPLAWLIIQKYMEHFSERAVLSPWTYIIAILTTGGVTFLTLFGQSYRAASENPVKALKNE